jgi:hypothetical protein
MMDQMEKDVPMVAATTVSYQEKIEERNTVEVIAPADLMGGYQFNVNTGNKSLLVAVVSSNVFIFRLLSPTSNLQTLNIYYAPCLFTTSLKAEFEPDSASMQLLYRTTHPVVAATASLLDAGAMASVTSALSDAATQCAV